MMMKIARRNSIVVLIALPAFSALIFALLYWHLLPGTPLAGTPARLLLSIWVSMGAGRAIAGITLIRNARKRAKGHPLNGLAWSNGIDGLLLAAGYVAPLVWLYWRWPRWGVITLLIVSGIGAWIVAVHTVLRTPAQQQTPHFEINPLLRAGEARLKKIQEAPGTCTAEEDEEWAPQFEQLLSAIRAEVAAGRADMEEV